MVKALAFLLLMATSQLSESQSNGSICVAPLLSKSFDTAGTPALLCRSGDFGYRVDRNPIVKWSRTESVRIDDLDRAIQHRITVYCDGKPNQSFRFRLAQFTTPDLCLFLNDLYQ